MKSIGDECLICNQWKRVDEILYVKLNFRQKPPVIAGFVTEWHSGIRIICKTCIDGLGGLLKDGDHA